MQVLYAKVRDFASYKELEFTFVDQGLTLISGPTGSGKSTLCDIIPWVCFGKTAKNGSVDEIRSWTAEGRTEGEIQVKVFNKVINIFRARGGSSKDNDLTYAIDGSAPTRGKDITDTQKQIDRLLGVSSETYLAGAYFHEFSQTAQFFTTTAKVRRAITEQLADLTLAKNLQEKSSLYAKEIKKEYEKLCQDVLLKKNTLEQLEKNRTSWITRASRWEELHKEHIEELETKVSDAANIKAKAIKALVSQSKSFEGDQKARIADMKAEITEMQAQIKPDAFYQDYLRDLKGRIDLLKSEKCGSCGAPKSVDAVLVLNKELYSIEREYATSKELVKEVAKYETRLATVQAAVNPYTAMIEQEKARKDTYKEQLEAVKVEANPHLAEIESAGEVIQSAKLELVSLETLVKELLSDKSDIELLSDVLDTFRGTVIKYTVEYLENHTNSLLTDHFDAELRVAFSATDADKLEVAITKDGNLCSYAQLSKGQRQLLKLCFGVSVMKAISNYNAVDFNCLWFDEALDGMDETIKAKSFTLLEKLAVDYSSVFVVEHSEAFKSLFTHRIEVNLVDGGSEIEQD